MVGGEFDKDDLVYERVTSLLDKVRRYNVNDPLVTLVSVDSQGIHRSDEFQSVYRHNDVIDALNKYASDLEKAVREYSKQYSLLEA